MTETNSLSHHFTGGLSYLSHETLAQPIQISDENSQDGERERKAMRKKLQTDNYFVDN